MTTENRQPPQQPLTPEELRDFLLWLFTHTGYAHQVDAWRAATQQPGAAAGGAATQE